MKRMGETGPMPSAKVKQSARLGRHFFKVVQTVSNNLLMDDSISLCF